jgi:hypothetical protein
MKYLMTMIVEEGGMEDTSPEEMKASMDRWQAFNVDAVAAGVLIAGEPLEESSAATTIKVGDGDRVTTDGPFAESKEQLGGFYLLECSDLDEALEWASKIPLPAGSIEVRPVRDLSGFGYESPSPSPVNAAA